jgi:hypothetical protein
MQRKNTETDRFHSKRARNYQIFQANVLECNLAVQSDVNHETRTRLNSTYAYDPVSSTEFMQMLAGDAELHRHTAGILKIMAMILKNPEDGSEFAPLRNRSRLENMFDSFRYHRHAFNTIVNISLPVCTPQGAILDE